jgi:SAM-dependent methyltransferase
MEWTENFYSKTGKWWGPAEAKISQRDRDRVRRIEMICGPAPQSVLELGSGYGTTAAATADAGYSVTACELSERIEFSDQFKSGNRQGALQFVQGDFYVTELGSGYDVVSYWNGFGIGSDVDQRRLLHRIANEWLAPEGKALIDVGNPFVRASWDGDREHKSAKPESGYAFTLNELTTYDPIANRFIDSWWEDGSEDSAIKQTIRNYSPADLVLLLEGTGLALEAILVAGTSIDMNVEHPSHAGLLHNEQEYLAVLVPAS